jgi:hypothetical protein
MREGHCDKAGVIRGMVGQGRRTRGGIGSRRAGLGSGARATGRWWQRQAVQAGAPCNGIAGRGGERGIARDGAMSRCR